MENAKQPLDEETLFSVTQILRRFLINTCANFKFASGPQYSVNEIARTLAFNQTTVSHQLRFLKI